MKLINFYKKSSASPSWHVGRARSHEDRIVFDMTIAITVIKLIDLTYKEKDFARIAISYCDPGNCVWQSNMESMGAHECALLLWWKCM